MGNQNRSTQVVYAGSINIESHNLSVSPQKRLNKQNFNNTALSMDVINQRFDYRR